MANEKNVDLLEKALRQLLKVVNQVTQQFVKLNKEAVKNIGKATRATKEQTKATKEQGKAIDKTNKAQSKGSKEAIKDNKTQNQGLLNLASRWSILSLAIGKAKEIGEGFKDFGQFLAKPFKQAVDGARGAFDKWKDVKGINKQLKALKQFKEEIKVIRQGLRKATFKGDEDAVQGFLSRVQAETQKLAGTGVKFETEVVKGGNRIDLTKTNEKLKELKIKAKSTHKEFVKLGRKGLLKGLLVGLGAAVVAVGAIAVGAWKALQALGQYNNTSKRAAKVTGQMEGYWRTIVAIIKTSAQVAILRLAEAVVRLNNHLKLTSAGKTAIEEIGTSAFRAHPFILALGAAFRKLRKRLVEKTDSPLADDLKFLADLQLKKVTEQVQFLKTKAGETGAAVRQMAVAIAKSEVAITKSRSAATLRFTRLKTVIEDVNAPLKRRLKAYADLDKILRRQLEDELKHQNLVVKKLEAEKELYGGNVPLEFLKRLADARAELDEIATRDDERRREARNQYNGIIQEHHNQLLQQLDTEKAKFEKNEASKTLTTKRALDHRLLFYHKDLLKRAKLLKEQRKLGILTTIQYEAAIQEIESAYWENRKAASQQHFQDKETLYQLYLDKVTTSIFEEERLTNWQVRRLTRLYRGAYRARLKDLQKQLKAKLISLNTYERKRYDLAIETDKNILDTQRKFAASFFSNLAFSVSNCCKS